MSALNIIVDRERAHLVTDGAGTTLGRLMVLVSKTVVLPHLGVAIGLRGNVGVTRVIAFIIGNYPTFASMKEQMPRDLRQHCRLRRRLFPSFFDFDVGIVGHDGRRPFGYLFSSCERPDSPAFQFCSVERAFASPPPSAEALAAVRTRNLDAAAMAVLDDQRRSEATLIGGYAQITSAGPNGFKIRLLCRWPDRQREKIDRQSPSQPAAAAYSGPRAVEDWRSM